MKPQPWSYTALSDFKNCPFAFHAKRVAKTVKDIPTEHTIWGERVHSAFEHRLVDGTPLPEDLQHHDKYLDEFRRLRGELLSEQKIALNTSREPCSFFDKNVWFRGIIDASKIYKKEAVILDFKTGKQHYDFSQLKLFSLYTFIKNPYVEYVTAKYYWTKTQTESEQTYAREDIPGLWSYFVPDLRQYVQAFTEDVWQKRPSGLCKGWCLVTTCDHWTPRR